MTTQPKYPSYAVLLAVVTLALVGCDHHTSRTNQTAPPTGAVHLASVEVATPPSWQSIPDRQSAPVLTCVLNDVSGSMSYYGARPLTVEDLLPLIDTVGEVGGEIAVGSIEARPTEPFLRLRLPPPEIHEPPTATNVFTRNKLLREWQKAEPERQAREARRQEHNRVQTEHFIHQLQQFLARPANAAATDIWNSLRRCEVFLQESDLYWTRVADAVPERFALLVSDGRQTVQNSMFTPLDPSIQVLAASGSREVGDFDRLSPPPLYFESPAAAVLYLTSTVGGK